MSGIPKSELLSRVPMFSGLNKKELGEVTRLAEMVTARDREQIVSEGTRGHEFYMVLTGYVQVRRAGKKVVTLGPGDYFGELALLDSGPRTATVVAEGDVSLMILGQRQFLGLLDEIPALSKKMLTSMAARLRVAELEVAVG